MPLRTTGYRDDMSEPSDTSHAAARMQREIFASMSGSERVAIAIRMSEEARDVTRNGIRHRHPDWDDQQVHRELLRLTLGDALAAKVLALDPKP